MESMAVPQSILFDDFEKVIQGGLRENTIYLVRGVPASGKTAFAMSVIKELMDKGRRLVFVTTELAPDDVVSHAKHGFTWDFEEKKKSNQLVFVDAYSWKIGVSSNHSYFVDLTNLAEFGNTFNEIIRKEVEESKKSDLPQESLDGYRPFFIVFDTATSLLLYNDPAMVAKFLQVQVARLRAANISGLILLEEGVSDQKIVDTLSFFMDGLFETKLLDVRGELKRLFRVYSMKSALHYSGWMEFKIGPEGFRFSQPLEEKMWEKEARRID